ncbi:DUF1289 domain-containing protein [Marinomonas algicola]|uniref:DUF1289 domain-containing protein n=1 Tax=Marinomonas algicola TaxID=2773454 RepID=UPI00174D2CA8|nr:DUF1289 domain-containing protein [Marinomonas algicola]
MKSKQKIKSPCVNMCNLDENDVCLGCYRSAKEITIWGRSSHDEKREIMAKVREREKNSPFYSE